MEKLEVFGIVLEGQDDMAGAEGIIRLGESEKDLLDNMKNLDRIAFNILGGVGYEMWSISEDEEDEEKKKVNFGDEIYPIEVGIKNGRVSSITMYSLYGAKFLINDKKVDTKDKELLKYFRELEISKETLYGVDNNQLDQLQRDSVKLGVSEDVKFQIGTERWSDEKSIFLRLLEGQAINIYINGNTYNLRY